MEYSVSKIEHCDVMCRIVSGVDYCDVPVIAVMLEKNIGIVQ